MNLILHLLVSCLGITAPQELRDTVSHACLAWAPYSPLQSVSVRYCHPDECQRVRSYGGGMYLVGERAIVIGEIDPNYFNYDPPPSREVGEYYLILHEYGHALGLRDNNVPTSIMKQGWDEPWANEPGGMEFNELYLYGVREFKP